MVPLLFLLITTSSSSVAVIVSVASGCGKITEGIVSATVDGIMIAFVSAEQHAIAMATARRRICIARLFVGYLIDDNDLAGILMNRDAFTDDSC